jgi:hypothetical protein
MARTTYEQIVRENIDNIREWRSNGFTINQICKKLGMKSRSLYLYLRTIPELADAWEFGNTKLVKEVLEPAILKQAVAGLPYVEVTEEMVETIDNFGVKKRQLEVTKRVHKVQYSPHILKYVLSCLEPDKWGVKAQENKDENKLDLSPALMDYSE